MASSSSSHKHNIAFSGIEPDSKRRKVSESSRLFDVFINHRGPDSKETLAVHLYNCLQELGLRAFLDCKEKENGEYFPSTIETAIRSASVHIAIFSERYAESAWCLAELVLMLESKAKIFPLFYGVKPSELRHIESGAYGNAFTKYKEKGRYLQKLASWNTALQSASLIAGSEIDSAESFCNSGCFKNFVLNVQKEVERTKPLYVAQHPVALHKLVKDFESQCLDKVVHDFENQCGLNRKGKNHSKIVGIFGMGGAGKTTLAKELFNRKRSNYMATCFLFDVREKSSRFGLPSLQVKLIKDLFHENPTEIESREEGCNDIRDRLRRSRFSSFLIVADDVDDVKQLDTLCLMDMANNSQNSLVIVTTRDVGLLTSSGITNRYNLKGLNRDDGRELFCWNSFGQPNPASGYEKLVDAFLDVCGGLPLSLQVLGRHVYDRPVYYWELQLCKVRESLDRDIRDILKISFDALHSVEKQIFMDIACFFVDKCKNTAIRVWEGSAWEGSGWRARYAVETLKDRCLVEETESLDGYLWEYRPIVFKMHDHLRDLGREISEELKSPPRHWCPKHRKSLETKGFQDILAQTKGRCFDSIYDRSTGSQITYFMGESEECGEASSSLLWLQLDLYCREFSSIPPWIPLQNLQCLRISHGCLKRLWQSNVQAPSQLKELQMYQTTLEEFPDFAGISNNLEQIVLDAKDMPIESWSLLESLRIYPRSLVLACSTLHGELACNNRGDETAFKSSCSTSLVIRNFVKLTDEMALNNIGESTFLKYPLSNLEHLEINNQMYVTNISICGNYCPSLSSLKIHDMEYLIEMNLLGVEKLKVIDIKYCKKLQNITLPSQLINLSLKGCRELQRLAGNADVTELRGMNVSECPELEELPSLDRMPCLQEIKIDSCGKLKFEDFRLGGMKFLERITLDGNVLVKYFELDSCQNLETVMFGCENLKELRIRGCPKLEKLPAFEGAVCLERVIIDGCGNFNCLELDGCQNLRSVSGNFELTKLYINQCPELEELASLSSMRLLEEIHIEHCKKMKNITLPTTLISLSIRHCRVLQRISETGDFMEITKTLSIWDCAMLEELPMLDTQRCTENIDIYDCEKLKNITLPTRLIRLFVGNCRDLQRVSVTGDFVEITKKLFIRDCPMLEELPMIDARSCVEEILIDGCEKVENIRGIEELCVSRWMTLNYCSNALTRKCIHKLKNVRGGIDMIIRAVDEAESSLNDCLFYDANISVDGVVEVTTQKTYPKWSERSAAVIFCFLVVLDTSTSVPKAEIIKVREGTSFRVRQGKWISTMVAFDDSSYHLYEEIKDVALQYGVIKKGFRVEVKRGEEWKTVGVLGTIVDKLHHS